MGMGARRVQPLSRILIPHSWLSKLIQATEISRIYRRGALTVTALDQVSFEIPSGSRVGLLGKSGSGKSTLLNLLGGLDRPTSGDLRVNDWCLSAASPQRLDTYRQQEVGFIFQQFRLIRHRTAAQNVELPLILAGVPLEQRRQQVTRALEKVDLLDRAGHFPAELSGGEQQRIAIARAIVREPRLILADEPTGNLDSRNADRVMKLLQELHQDRRCTLILVTHDEPLARNWSERILRLQDGRMVETHPALSSSN